MGDPLKVDLPATEEQPDHEAKQKRSTYGVGCPASGTGGLKENGVRRENLHDISGQPIRTAYGGNGAQYPAKAVESRRPASSPLGTSTWPGCSSSFSSDPAHRQSDAFATFISQSNAENILQGISPTHQQNPQL